MNGGRGGRPAVSRFACGTMMAASLLLVLLMALPGGREQAFEWLNPLGQWVPGFWSGLSALGDTLLALALLLPLVLWRPALAGLLAWSALIATAVTHTLKPMLDVPRPAGILPPDELTVLGHTLTSQAFPSGHTVTAFALAGLLVVGLGLRGWQAGVVLVAAGLIGLSRITVGAHWPTDVLAGALIGWVSVLAAALLLWRWPALAGGRWVFGGALLVLAGCVVTVPFFDTGYPQGLWMNGLVVAWAICGSLFVLRGRKLKGEALLKGA
ncbi:MAG: phosphatase PAP2 family protein [Halothiobacillaceae bacterium]